MLDIKQKLNINPIVVKVQIRFLPDYEPPISVVSELYDLLKSYFQNDSIVLKSNDFSHTKIKKDLSTKHFTSFNFESKDIHFASTLCQLKFPNDLQISCVVNHVSNGIITNYISKITYNKSKALCFEITDLSAKNLRKLFPDKPNLYDKKDFFSENISNLNPDNLSSNIYASKKEFYKKELHIEVPDEWKIRSNKITFNNTAQQQNVEHSMWSSS